MTKARDLANASTALSAVSATELGYVDGVTSAIQTQVDAKIAKTLTTTTGDIIYASGANTPARLGIGSSAQVLTVSGGVPAWATPAAGGGMTLLSTTTLSGSSTTVSSISQSYKDLYVLVVNQNGGGGQVLLKPNNTANAMGSGLNSNGGANPSAYTIINDWLQTNAYGSSSNTTNFYQVYFNNYASTTAYKPYQYQGGHLTDASVRQNAFINGYLASNSAVTSIVVTCESGSFSAGTIYVYGVN